MSMRVDETRQNNFAGRVELGRTLVGKPVGWSGPLNHTAANLNTAVVNNVEFRQLASAARAPRSCDRDQLSGMNDV